MPSQNQILSSLHHYNKKFKEQYGIEELGIFGSYARNTANEKSDIDVFIQLKHSNLFLLSKIRIELEELLGLHTDLVQIRDTMNPYLKKHIENEAISA